MPPYRVLIKGSHCVIRDPRGKPRPHGFQTAREVNAANENQAITRAIDSIRSHTRINAAILNEEDDSPRMQVDGIQRLDEPIDEAAGQPGIIWYPEVRKKWWQFWKTDGSQ